MQPQRRRRKDFLRSSRGEARERREGGMTGVEGGGWGVRVRGGGRRGVLEGEPEPYSGGDQ